MLQRTSNMATGSCITRTTQTAPYYSFVKNIGYYRDISESVSGIRVYSGPIDIYDSIPPRLTDSTNFQNNWSGNEDQESANSVLSDMESSNLEVNQSTPRLYGKFKRASRRRNLKQEFDSVFEGIGEQWTSPEWVTFQPTSNQSKRSSIETNSRSYFSNCSHTSSKQRSKLNENDVSGSRHISFTIPSNRKSYLRHFKAKPYAHSTPIKENFRKDDSCPSRSSIHQCSQPEIKVGTNASTQTSNEELSSTSRSFENEDELNDHNRGENRQRSNVDEFNFGKYMAALVELEKMGKETERMKAFNKRNDLKRYFNFNDYCKRIYDLKEKFDRNE